VHIQHKYNAVCLPIPKSSSGSEGGSIPPVSTGDGAVTLSRLGGSEMRSPTQTQKFFETTHTQKRILLPRAGAFASCPLAALRNTHTYTHTDTYTEVLFRLRFISECAADLFHNAPQIYFRLLFRKILDVFPSYFNI